MSEGKLMAREPWSLREDSDGTRHIIAERDASAFGVHLRVVVAISVTGEMHAEFELRWAQDGPVKKRAYYHAHKGQVSWRVNATDDWQIVAPKRAHFFPLMRIFTADMVRALQGKGGQGSVIVPSIATLADLETVFTPLLSQRSITGVVGDPHAVDLSGGAYDAPARLCFNQDGLLRHYSFCDAAGQAWQCELVD
jgi:hypothetical protein